MPLVKAWNAPKGGRGGFEHSGNSKNGIHQSTFSRDPDKTGGFKKKPPGPTILLRSLESNPSMNLDQSAFHARALVGAVGSGGLDRELV